MARTTKADLLREIARLRARIEELESAPAQRAENVVSALGLPKPSFELDLVRRGELPLHRVAAMARLGLWIWDHVDNRLEYFSDNLPKLYGCTAEEYAERLKNGLDDAATHRDDLTHYIAETDRATDRERPYTVDYRQRVVSGEQRYFLEHGEPIHDAEGRLVKTVGTVQDITDFKDMFDSLRQSELLLREATRMAKLGLWVWDDHERRYSYASEQMARMYGRSPEDFLEWFSTGDLFEGVHPDDRDRYVRTVGFCDATRQSYTLDYREFLEGGELRHFRETARPVLDELGRQVKTLGVVQDITEHKEALEAQRQSAENFRALVEGSIQGIVIFRDMRPLFANQACAEIFGFASIDGFLTVENLLDLVHPDDRRAVKQRHKAGTSAKGSGNHLILRFLRSDGTTIWLESSVTVVDWESEPAILATFVDITERKQSEDALLRAHEDLERRVQARTDELETINAALQREILERRHTQERLAASEERLRQACRLVGLGHYVWDSIDDRCLVCSDEQARIHGTSPNAYIAQSAGIAGSHPFTHPDDRDRHMAEISELRRTGKGFEIEYRSVTVDGDVRHVREIVRPVLDGEGRVVLELGVTQDITDRKRTEQALREQGARLHEALQIAQMAYWTWDGKTDGMVFAPEMAKILGRSGDEPFTISFEDYLAQYVHPDDVERARRAMNRPDVPGDRYETQYRVVTESGDIRWVADVGETVHSETGQFTGEVGTIQDITERKEAEQAVERSEARLAKALHQSRLAHWTYDFARHEIVEWSDEAAYLLGIEPHNLPKLYEDYLEWVHPDDRVAVKAFYEAENPSNPVREEYQVEYRIKRGDGAYIWLNEMAEVECDETGAPKSFVGAIQDITARKLSESALRQSEERFRGVVENSPSAIFLQGRDGRFQMVNRQFEEWYGLPATQSIGKTSHDLFPKKFADVYAGMDRQVLDTGQTCIREVDMPFGDGTTHTVLSTKFPVASVDGGISGIGTINMDVTEHKHARSALDEQRLLLETIINTADIAINVKDKDYRYVFVNEATAGIFGVRPDDMIGKTAAEAFGESHGKLVEGFDSRALDSGLPLIRFEHRNPDWQGTDRSWLTTKAVVRTESGDLRYIVSASVDLTDLKAREQELFQAQKMDALGKMTSGIAHDFNNLLLLINANLFVLQKDHTSGVEGRRAGDSIRLATETANNLTRSLMAFSRDQPLAPAVVNLPETIDNTVNSLFRTLMGDMEIETRYIGKVNPVLIDSQYLENALLNLALNARDAMPGGGTVRIEVENFDRDKSRSVPGLPAGEFVKIAVTDTGVGMTAEVLDQALQPFFTTKAKGSGTGLGLSMVYRFVKQSGGHITLASRPAKGTTVSIYLPVARNDLTLPADGDLPVPSLDLSKLTILVTEDDEPVRRTTVKLLQEEGFHTVEAANADQALTILGNGSAIDLLFSDVYLKGSINGYELAAKAKEMRPDLKIAFCSGNAARPDSRSSVAEAPLLRKPYSPDDLRRIIAMTVGQRQKVDSPQP